MDQPWPNVCSRRVRGAEVQVRQLHEMRERQHVALATRASRLRAHSAVGQRNAQHFHHRVVQHHDVDRLQLPVRRVPLLRRRHLRPEHSQDPLPKVYATCILAKSLITWINASFQVSAMSTEPASRRPTSSSPSASGGVKTARCFAAGTRSTRTCVSDPSPTRALGSPTSTSCSWCRQCALPTP